MSPKAAIDDEAGRRRVVIEGVRPEIDCGRYPAKGTVGERLAVEADVFADGHDVLRAVVRWRRAGARTWRESPMSPTVNDRWRGSFPLDEPGRYTFTLEAWVDRFATWLRDLRKRVDAGQDVAVELLAGAELVEAAARRTRGPDAVELRARAGRLREEPPGRAVATATDAVLADLVAARPDRALATRYGRELEVVVDRERARFGAWYELFPRSASPDPERHGTLADVIERLPYVAAMGFDVLYLPPVHPIGRTNRKGRNNAEEAEPGDPGSPWAIGAKEGGHTAVHPDLGTIDDFDRLVAAAGELGLEVAIDLAYQCSPDHPWVREHPEWFRHRPDGSIRFAENPPKKYQDIYPIDFESEDWQALWKELRSVVEFWMDHGVRIFRVDNPHTKPFAFWDWMINDLKAGHPELIFLSEAFTRPRVMHRLAKLGFTQSYTYFAWRTSKHDLVEYFTELTTPPVVDFLRPNLWPNTPDILTEQLQQGGRPAFVQRLLLAATLGASYGIYGPAFELMEGRALREGSEEYLDSEKYQVRRWDLADDRSLAELIARINRIRHENPALHGDRSLRFHHVDNDALIAYSKRSDDGTNLLLMVVSLDPERTQAGMVELPLEDLGIEEDATFQAHDLISDAHHLWHGRRNYVELNPHVSPGHILRLRPRVRTEEDFEGFR